MLERKFQIILEGKITVEFKIDSCAKSFLREISSKFKLTVAPTNDKSSCPEMAEHTIKVIKS